MSNNLQLCWLRADLRITDNQALWHASQSGPAVAVFIVTANDWRAHDDAPVKIDFWRRNLQALTDELSQRHIPLQILHADAWNEPTSRPSGNSAILKR